MLDLGSFSDRVLIFGGPYSNLAATQAMQARARQLEIPPSRVICSGDSVAYCGEPAETVELIRAWGIPVVMGNCEESLAAAADDCGCGFDADSHCSALAATWYRFADRRVSSAQRRWMSSLPRSIEFTLGERRIKVVHGSLGSINEFVFASSNAAAKRAQLDAAGVDVIVGGHSGIPFGQEFACGLWLNAGVIGMPANDGGRYGWYLLIEPLGDHLEFGWHRLDYDFERSARSTIAAGMREYGQALRDGLWPSMDVLPAAERDRRGLPLTLQNIRIGKSASAHCG